MRKLRTIRKRYTTMKQHNGRYAILIEDKHGLTIRLTDAGHEELAVNREQYADRWTDFDHVTALLEDFTGNGWEWLHPEDIGALTDCRLILSDDVTIEDNGDVTIHGSVYWHERYAVEDAAEVLETTGELWLQRGDDTTE